ncbi:YchJ family protein [Flavobacterium lacisediminis]|uniref:YchJ family metal-binding protein n=1 Tax=Flavobacterium lacisediminis TaxID=2989705 RepID=A0ABT3EK07_9FLAO|nr:YchJ family metal-binding protein [Flavobacterium lacisediminis]MCW1148901.1 YchJ family metal-binding protein [Flavobacterium lacisediminis]
MSGCYCGNSVSFQNCCEPYIKGIKNAPTAEALMRSRYSAFAVGAADYLINTTHISKRKYHNKRDILAWSQANKWLKLEVLASTETTVTFKAYFLDENLKAQVHYEHSTFKLENDKWFYVDGEY